MIDWLLIGLITYVMVAAVIWSLGSHFDWKDIIYETNRLCIALAVIVAGILLIQMILS